MSAVAAIGALATLTTSALEIITALNKAAQVINARQQRGGDFTAEELAELDKALALSKSARDEAIAKAPLIF